MAKIVTHQSCIKAIQVNGYTIRTEMFEGKEHIVVPVVMMVEGIHNGSGGPVFHSAEELGHIVPSWNGIPVVIYHPQDPNENYISANSPEVLEKENVGRIFNAFMDGVKLKAEAWIDVNKLSIVNPQTLAMLKRQEPIEVSVGVFTDNKYVEGNWHDEHYTSIATNHRPDHLALLPGEVGACSIKDGCGIRVNKKGEQLSIKDNVLALLKEGFISFHVNQEGYSEVMSAIQSKLNSMDSGSKYHYLVDCFPDNFVYSVRGSDDEKLCRQNYSVANDGSIVFNGEAIKVKRDVSYIEVNKLEVNKMADDKDKKCKGCPAKVLALIANTSNPYTDNDQEFLNTLEEDRLDQLLDMTRTLQTNSDNIKTLQINSEKPVTITKEQILAACAGMSKAEYLAFAPAEIREQLEIGDRMQTNKKAEIVTKITANSKAFTKEELDGKSLVELDKIASLIQDPVDYSGNLGANFNVNRGSDKAIPVLLPGNIQ